MTKPFQRIQFTDGQFLQVDDFNTEQAYNLGMHRFHQSTLHDWGITGGLEVKFKAGSSTVDVTGGSAVDTQGRDLTLPDTPGAADVSGLQGPAEKSVYLTLSYQEQPGDLVSEAGPDGKVVTGATRWNETPKLDLVDAPADPGVNLILARITLDTSGKITKIDASERRLTGPATADLTGNSLTLTDLANPNPPQLAMSPAAAGSTVLTKANLATTGDLAVTGNLNCPAGGATFAGPVAVQDGRGVRQQMTSLGGNDARGYTLSFNIFPRGDGSLNWDYVDPKRPSIVVRIDDSEQGKPIFNVASTANIFFSSHLLVEGESGDVTLAANGPGERLDVKGTVFSHGVIATSDLRLKDGILPIPDALQKICAIRGVFYERKDAPGDRDLGVVAQDVEPVLPELVWTGPDGMKAVDYSRLSAVLIEAFKELGRQVSDLESRMELAGETQEL